MATIRNSSVKVRTTASRGEHDGVLFYILPPLLLGAVFAFCAMANSKGMETEEQPGIEAAADE